MVTVLAFILALGILIAVHEYGHYRIAIACGVKVLRFSVGFGKPLLRWKNRVGTEFVVGAIPLGGYVRMLDERVAPVDATEQHCAFNRQSLKARAAIVVAGPLANLFFACLLYALVGWIGVQEPKAILSAPAASSAAAQAGLKGREHILQYQISDTGLESVRSFEHLRWVLAQAALDKRDVSLFWQEYGIRHQSAVLKLSTLPVGIVEADIGRAIGIAMPWRPPVIDRVLSGGVAEVSGLQSGDLVVRAFGVDIVDAEQLRQLIRRNPGVVSEWQVERKGHTYPLRVAPEVVSENGLHQGRVGAYVGSSPEMDSVQLGFVEGIAAGVKKTWEVAVLSLKMIGRMLIGEASLKNLSGPLTIADYAGKSATLGALQYLSFLALISVSLGVLNLLPLPVLDGGHLMYYLWEGVTGHPVSDVWMDRLQKIGVSVLLTMMCIAFFNDISRLLA